MILNYRTSTLRRLLSSIACGILLTAFTGCSNNQSTSFDDDLPNVGAPVEINIRTNGIESFADAEEVATRAALADSTAAEQTEQTVHTQVQPLDGGGLLVVTVKASKATRVAAASPTHTRAIPLKSTTLCVLAYNSDGQYVDECLYDVDGSGIATAMNGQQLVVPARATPYTFYCYSPGVSCYSNTDTKEVSVGAADAFAFGTQKVTVNGSSSMQTVSFPTLTQKMAPITMAVTGVDRYTAELSGVVNSATFSLTSGTFSGFDYTSTHSIQFATSITEHLILPVNTGGMILTLSGLVVDGKVLSSSRFALPNLTLDLGTRYTLRIKFDPDASGERRTSYVVLPAVGLRVATSNLQYSEPLVDDGTWYPAPHPGYYSNALSGGDYFCWGDSNYDSYFNDFGTDMKQLDEGCAQVYGYKWRVPTIADYEKLLGGAHCWSTYVHKGDNIPGMYFGIGSPPSLSEQDRYAFFPAGGHRSYYGPMTDVGITGHYWSSEGDGANHAKALEFSSSTAALSSHPSRLGFSVRCVTDH